MPGTSRPFRPARWSAARWAAGTLVCRTLSCRTLSATSHCTLGDVPCQLLRLASLTDFFPACPLPGLPLPGLPLPGLLCSNTPVRAQQHAESATACPVRRGLNTLISSAHQL